MILTIDDFSDGLIKVGGSKSNQNTTSDFETFITEYKENEYIRRMLGFETGNEFIDDLTGSPSVPSTAKWLTIFNPFNFQHNNGRALSCIGIKDILAYLIYNDYVSQQSIQNQYGGNVSIRSEAATKEGIVGKSTAVHNRAVEQIDILQAYMEADPNEYPNFKGEYFQYQSGI